MKKRRGNREGHVKSSVGSTFHDIILGGQDGLVNVLGVILAMAAATNEARIVIIAGIAANLAESLSMAAVAYTSTKAYNQYYDAQAAKEKREIKEVPRQERKEIYEIYYRKGFRGRLLGKIVEKITSSKKLWLKTVMTDELKLADGMVVNPLHSALIVGVAAIVGSTIPLLPFFFVSIGVSVWISLVLSTMALFITGAMKAKYTMGSWMRNGMEMAVIGMVTALVGYGLGLLLGKVV